MALFKIWFSGHKTKELTDQAWCVKQLPNGELKTYRDIVIPGVTFVFEPERNAPVAYLLVDSDKARELEDHRVAFDPNIL